MEATKRRKLNSVEQPQVLSAFARLRQSQRQQEAPQQSLGTSVSSRDANEQDIPIQTARQEVESTPVGTKSRRTRSSQKVVIQESRTPDRKLQTLQDGLSTPYDAGRLEHAVGFEDIQTPVPPTPVVQFSGFKPTKSNFQKKAGGKLRLKLSEGERLVVLGSYGIHVISGGITILGAMLKSSEKVRWVHAPHCNALPVIRCPEEAVIEIESHPAAESIRKLGMLSPLFRRLWNDAPPLPSQGKKKQASSTFEILFTSADGPRRTMLSDLKAPPEWKRETEKLVIASRSKPIVAMVTGPKSSGKSTFGKLLTNQLLTDVVGRRHAVNVAVMDLDPGQPEHGVPGQVSLVHVKEPLLGPSFCRPMPGVAPEPGTATIRSHSLASISPASDPKLYLDAAADLFNHYHNQLGSLPLVINTPGWIQGTGLDLLTALVGLFRPSHVIYMATGPIDVIETLQGSFKSGELAKLPSQTTQYTSRTAAHLRSMQTMSYFHADTRPSKKSGIPFSWNPNALSTILPWQLRYTGPTPGILGVMCYDYQAPPDLLADAINGTIVAVVEVENVQAFRVGATGGDELGDQAVLNTDLDEAHEKPTLEYVKRELTNATPEGIPFINTGSTLNPKYSQTIGLALVRGIDAANGMLQVLTPIPEDRIEQVNEKGGRIVLVSGKFDPPSWAYTEDLYQQTSLEHEDGDGDSDEEGRLDAMEDDLEGVSSDLEKEGGEELEVEEAEERSASPVSMPTPWIEVLHGNQKRGVGSRVWRVRRDLGRMGNAGD